VGRVFCIPEISDQAEESFLGAERSNENGAALLFAVIYVPPYAGRGEFFAFVRQGK